MKKMYSILTGMLLPLLCTAQSGKFELTIHAPAAKPGTKAYLLYQYDGNKVIDSSVVKAHQIYFSNTIVRPLRASIVLDDKRIGLPALLKSRGVAMDVLQLYLHPGTIIGRTSTGLAQMHFASAGISADFQAYQHTLKENDDQLSVISQQIINGRDTLKLKLLEHRYDSLKIARMPLIKAFIKAHPASYIGLVAWQEYNGYLQKLDHYQQLSPARLAESKLLFDQLSYGVRKTDEGKNAARLFMNSLLLKPGAPAPDFAQPDATGKIIKLSDYKGKYVLLDFWASWCGPCRQNNPQLVKLYNLFANRNLTILGISLDDKEGRSNWLKAIKTDGLTWTQVSDLQHWDNQVVKLYSVNAIPRSILIAPDGTIAADNPNVEELTQLLNKAFPAGK